MNQKSVLDWRTSFGGTRQVQEIPTLDCKTKVPIMSEIKSGNYCAKVPVLRKRVQFCGLQKWEKDGKKT